MKQIFTLLSFVFFAANANAQLTEKFENYSALATNCWQLTKTSNVTANSLVISDNASIGTAADTTSLIRTPYLDIAGSTTVSFNYRLNSKLNNNSIRTIEIGTTDKNGTFSSVKALVLDKNTDFNTIYSFNQPLTLPSGTYRFTIRVVSAMGDGNSYVILDNLSVSASYHYGMSPCNTAPVATDANFGAPTAGAYNGSLSSKASDANAGETLTFSVVDAPTANGTFALNSDGSFVFTPAGNFAGGPVTFTYKVTDNGYDPLGSNTATVTIIYPAMSPLPVTVSTFSASLTSSGNAQFSWTVEQNENGNQFTLEKSSDGKNFSAAAVVMTTIKTGQETYRYTDASFSGKAFYRLKVVADRGITTYSKVVYLQQAGEARASNLTLLQNPVASTINFDYTAAQSGTGSINVYNLAGTKIFTAQIIVNKGKNTTSVNLSSNVVPGSYILEVVNGSERSVAKLLKR